MSGRLIFILKVSQNLILHIFVYNRHILEKKFTLMFSKIGRFVTVVSIFSFKLLNFSISPKVLREVIWENFEKLNEPETSTSDKPESVRVPRNRKVVISPDTPITKYNSYTLLWELVSYTITH